MLGCVRPHIRPVSTSSAIHLFMSLAYFVLPFGFLSHIYNDLLLKTFYILDTIIWLYVLQIHFLYSHGLSPPGIQ